MEENDRIPLSGYSLNDWTKTTQRIDGNTISIYEKGEMKVFYDGWRWKFNDKIVSYLDEIK